MLLRVSLLALALFTSPVLAQDYDRQDLVRGLCQKDGCDEFTILAADRIKTIEDGTLFRTRCPVLSRRIGPRMACSLEPAGGRTAPLMP